MKHGSRQPLVRDGVTLIETLAAIVLATILTAGLTGVLSLLAKQQRLLRHQTDSPWRHRVETMLRWDLEQAVHWEVTDNQLELVGHGSLSAKFGRPTHRRTRIVYRNLKTELGTWLIREEFPLDVGAELTAHRDLYLPGEFSFQTYQLDGTPRPLPETGRVASPVELVMASRKLDNGPVVRIRYLR